MPGPSRTRSSAIVHQPQIPVSSSEGRCGLTQHLPRPASGRPLPRSSPAAALSTSGRPGRPARGNRPACAGTTGSISLLSLRVVSAQSARMGGRWLARPTWPSGSAWTSRSRRAPPGPEPRRKPARSGLSHVPHTGRQHPRGANWRLKLADACVSLPGRGGGGGVRRRQPQPGTREDSCSATADMSLHTFGGRGAITAWLTATQR